MIKETVGRDPEVVKAIVSAIKNDEDVGKFIRGFVHDICGEMTAFVCNLPWEDTRKALLELVSEEEQNLLMSDKAKEWWEKLITQVKIYLNFLLEQAKQYIEESQESEESKEGEESEEE